MIAEITDLLFSGNFIFLLIACFFAAFIDAIAGGGGLITIPAYLATGMPPHMALGSNKFSSFLSTIASSAKFVRSGKVNWPLLKKTMIFAFVGAALGVKTILLLDSKYLYPVTIVLLIAVLGYTLFNKKLGEDNEFEGLNKKNIFQGCVMSFALGFYDGFFGPGTGSFLIFLLIRIFKLDFTNASGNAKILNLISNLASLILFIYFKKVNYLYSIPVAIIMIFGAILGAKMAVLKGASFIKPIFVVVTTIVLIKMVAESIFHVNLTNEISVFIMTVLS